MLNAFELGNICERNAKGFTVDVEEGHPVGHGYAVGLTHGLTVFDAVEFAHRLLMTQVMGSKPLCYGGWFDEAQNEFVLDVSVVVDSESDAILLGRMFQQDAVFHLDSGTEIRLRPAIVEPEKKNLSKSESPEFTAVPRSLVRSLDSFLGLFIVNGPGNITAKILQQELRKAAQNSETLGSALRDVLRQAVECLRDSDFIENSYAAEVVRVAQTILETRIPHFSAERIGLSPMLCIDLLSILRSNYINRVDGWGTYGRLADEIRASMVRVK